jgi:hypothetical protein
MSDLAIGRGSGAGAAEAGFRARTVAWMLAIGILSFVALLLLGAYAPDMRSGKNGGAHALSNAAVGYSGIVRLAAATGRNPRIIRSDHSYDAEELLVLTPESGATDISGPLEPRTAKVTLFVLPKWETNADKDHRGWVRHLGLKPVFDPAGVLSPRYMLHIRRHPSGGRPLVTVPDLPQDIRFTAPRPLQVIVGINPKAGPGVSDPTDRIIKRTLLPLVTDGAGGIIVARIGDAPLYVLSDPDLISNIGMNDPRNAASALALLDWLNSTGAKSIDFDVTLNGFGHSPSPLKLAFEPPFLAMTLALAAAILLAGLHALGRFGPVRRRERAIAFGKAALVDNSAAMLRKAGREARLGGRYAAVIRDRAVTAFAVPARLHDGAIDVYLDGLNRRMRFTALVEAAEAADDRHSMVGAARALHDWQKEKDE